jgi:hypothetical protein
MYVAYNNDQSMERLVHANSWPFVQLGSGNVAADGASILAFDLKNAGTGPARIYSFEFLIDGRPVSNRNLFVNIAHACCQSEFQAAIARGDPREPFAGLGAVTTAPIAPGLLAANDEVTALSWPRTAGNIALWRAMDQARQLGRIQVRACYCSVFDECWTARTETLPTPRNTCVPARPAH